LALGLLLTGITASAAGPFPKPSWIKEGILAASSMEPSLFLIRRGGERADVAEWYRAQRTEKAVQRLKDVGVNLMVINPQKEGGLTPEKEDIQSSRKFTELLHHMGMKSGGYVGASLMYETIFNEIPESRDWIQKD